jgi:putative Mn2+ efflux pump MntP
MYSNALMLHGFLRWLAILSVLFAFVRALSGWMGDRPRNTLDRLSAMIALFVVDVQFLIGLGLYFLWSPLTKTAREDFGAAMKNDELRYWAVEHVTAMIVAIALVHIGKVLANKSKTPRSQHGRAVLCFGLALVLMVWMTPWPMSHVPRPWFRT